MIRRAAPAPAPASLVERQGILGTTRAWRIALEDRRIALSLAMLAVVVVVGVLAPWLAPHDPAEISVGTPNLGPSLEFPFGTDSLGRDQLSRIIFGTRISINVAIVVATTALLIGTPIGMLVGYFRGPLDFVVSRVLDVLFAFPTILLALVISTLLRPSLETAAIALIIVYVPVTVRFVRSTVLAEQHRDYVLSARVAGASSARILIRHILPNIASPVLVLASTIMAFTVLAEAALSYLGFGAQPPTSSWGKMLTENSAQLSSSPHLAIFPGIAITYLVLALNMLGDGLRDHLDPRFRSVA